jgi:hypothetical protein
MCNGESACTGGLINGGDRMLFLGMIDGSDTTLLLAGTGGLINARQRHDASSLGWLMVWLFTCNGKSACVGRLINSGDMMLFLGMIDGGNTTLLPLAGR